MNALEIPNLREYTIHKSVVVLLFKGGFAWLLLVLTSYGFNRLQDLSSLAGRASISGDAPSIFQLILHILYGWLILYVILSWFFEYYIVRKDAIIIKKGIIFTREDVFQIEDVKIIDIVQGFMGKLLKYGTMKIYAFRSQRWVYLENIDNPHAIAAFIHSLHPAPMTVQRSARVLMPSGSARRGRQRLVYAYDDGEDEIGGVADDEDED
ncbi:MAG: PH domain-containing protein [Candidatus Doudnabacteria bacterium]|nr:PH domain-containing protein [Candidatus Doudnabacteria bacterium]